MSVDTTANTNEIADRAGESMSEAHGMRMARAYPEQIQAMREWFNRIEELLDQAGDNHQEIGEFVEKTFAANRIDEYERILFGYETLIENACDPTLTYLEFKPEILAAMKKDK
jgi:hypothetical protein